MEEEKDLIPNYGMEKEATTFDENGGMHKIRIMICWDKGKTLLGVKEIIKEAKALLDSMVR